MPDNNRSKQNSWWKFVVSSVVALIIGVGVGVATQTYNIFLTNKVEQDTKKVLKTKIARENEIKKKRLDEELMIGLKRLDEDYQAWLNTMSPIFAAKLDSFKNCFPKDPLVRDNPAYKLHIDAFKEKNINKKIAIKKEEIERKIKVQKEDLDMLLDF